VRNYKLDPSDNLNLPRRGGRRARHRIQRLRTDVSSPEGNDQPASRPWRTAPTSPPGGVFRRTAEPAPRAGPASQSTQPRAGSGGRTNPLRHRRLCTDSPSRAASHTRTAGPWDQSCPRPVAEPWRSDISERSCACVRMTSGGCSARRSRRGGCR
jgi:hypothetical protein